MEDVAAAAGVTRGLLHHYFGTKRDLHLELMRDMLRAIPVPVPDFVQGVTPEQRLADSVDRWLDAIWRNRRMWLATLGGAGLGRDPEAERIWDRARDASVDSMIGVLGLGPATLASDALRGLLRSYAAFAEDSHSRVAGAQALHARADARVVDLNFGGPRGRGAAADRTERERSYMTVFRGGRRRGRSPAGV